MTHLVVAHTEPGDRREAFLRRVLLGTLDHGLAEVVPTAGPAEQDAFRAAARRESSPTSRPVTSAGPSRPPGSGC